MTLFLIKRSFIHQSFSWGPLNVKEKDLQKLFTRHTVSPMILDAIYEFGAKVTGEDDPYFTLTERRLHYDPLTSHVASIGQSDFVTLPISCSSLIRDLLCVAYV